VKVGSGFACWRIQRHLRQLIIGHGGSFGESVGILSNICLVKFPPKPTGKQGAIGYTALSLHSNSAFG